ncbi:hypothetical protein JXB37_08345 [candidate division WOR-3 bacterium]|nr:hypothetical protein [candidate division WOR-3 bacterium]
MNRTTVTGLLILTAVLLLIAACGGTSNPVADYLLESEVRCENETQRCNICNALQDIILLAPDQLRERRYCDYAGSPNRWDLPTLVQRHFVPARSGATLGPQFYQDVKATEVRQWAEKTLARLTEIAPLPVEPETAPEPSGG